MLEYAVVFDWLRMLGHTQRRNRATIVLVGVGVCGVMYVTAYVIHQPRRICMQTAHRYVDYVCRHMRITPIKLTPAESH